MGDGTEGEYNIDSYHNLKNDPSVTGQVHHLNQDAAFKDVIPYKDGMSIELQGDAFRDIGSEHYEAHRSLEQFWNQYRKGGEFYRQSPTIGQYNKALYNALRDAGVSASEATYALQRAIWQQKQYGLFSNMFVPRVPGKINQKKR